MNKRTSKNFQPEQKSNSELKDDEMQFSPAIGNTNVACRFGLSHRWGLSFITWYSNKKNLSLETTLRMAAKWLNFIYRDSPFSMCQRKALSKNLKSFFAGQSDLSIYALVLSLVALLQSSVVVYLTIKLLMK